MSREELPDWLWPMDCEAKVKTYDDDEDEQSPEQDDDHDNQQRTHWGQRVSRLEWQQARRGLVECTR